MILGCVTCLQGWKLPAGGAGDVVGHCPHDFHTKNEVDLSSVIHGKTFTESFVLSEYHLRIVGHKNGIVDVNSNQSSSQSCH